jgi:hypothetical protein
LDRFDLGQGNCGLNRRWLAICGATTTHRTTLGQLEAVPSPEQLQALRAVEALELAGSPEAHRLLEVLARGAPEARLTREAKDSSERHATRPTAIPYVCSPCLTRLLLLVCRILAELPQSFSEHSWPTAFSGKRVDSRTILIPRLLHKISRQYGIAISDSLREDNRTVAGLAHHPKAMFTAAMKLSLAPVIALGSLAAGTGTLDQTAGRRRGNNR